jgi:hypothetical protein
MAIVVILFGLFYLPPRHMISNRSMSISHIKDLA